METKGEVTVIEKNQATPAETIQLALNKGANLKEIAELMTLQERWEKNEALKAYNQAMSDFKANPPEINKDKTVGYDSKTGGKVGYKHASLYNVTEKINSALSKHGLSASWTTKQNGAIAVTCKITHVKGHSEETTLSAQADTTGAKNSIQAIGSTVTYLSRYTLLALTGLATFDDDDGQTAGVEYIDDKQKSQLVDMLTVKNVKIDFFCSKFNIETLEKLPKEKYQQAVAALTAKKVAK
jgi:hypothetical protein